MKNALSAFLTSRNRQEPDIPALTIGRTTRSWAEVHRIAAGLANRLADFAGPKRLRVGFVSEASAHLPFLVWAAILRDDDLLFLPARPDSAQRPGTTEAMRTDIVFAPTRRDHGDAGILALDEWFEQATALRADCDDAEASSVLASPQGAFIFQTSGTEGEPKTVVTPYRHYREVIEAMQACGALDHANRQTCFVSQPLYHSYGLCSYLEYAACGSHVILPSGTSPLGPVGDLSDPWVASQVTAVEGVPHFWSLCARLAARVLAPRLRHIGLGGGGLDEAVIHKLLERFPGVTVSVRYGLTETPSVVSHKLFAPPYATGWRSSGRVVPAYRVVIVADDGTPAAGGEEGEIVVFGDCVAASNGALRTGDLGFFSAEGELHVTGRKSAFIKHRGFRISPEPIESALMQFPGIHDCRVRGADEQLIAELVEEPPVSRRDLISHLRRELPANCIPDRFVAVLEIPRTYSGKIKRSG